MKHENQKRYNGAFRRIYGRYTARVALSMTGFSAHTLPQTLGVSSVNRFKPRVINDDAAKLLCPNTKIVIFARFVGWTEAIQPVEQLPGYQQMPSTKMGRFLSLARLTKPALFQPTTVSRRYAMCAAYELRAVLNTLDNGIAFPKPRIRQ